MSIVLPIIGIVLLFAEGFLLAQTILGTRERLLPCLLAFPLSSVINAWVFYVLTITTLPLSFLSVVLPHLLIIGILAWRRTSIVIIENTASVSIPLHITLPMWGKWICILLLAISLAYGTAQTFLLPSLHIDTLTNWAMRSQISFVDRHIAFDPTEVRGMAKPQYPILIHALQILGSIGQHTWNDRAANVMTWLLTFGGLSAAGVMMRRLVGSDGALLYMTILLQLPLIAVHLSQGYGDLPLMIFCLLSWLSLGVMQHTQEKRWLVISTLMMAGAMWTKSEGLFIAFVPWAISVALMMKHESWKNRLLWIGAGFITYLPWMILLFVKGLHLTPHESDGSLGIKWEGFAALPHAFIGSGSFGVFWVALLVSLVVLLMGRTKHVGVWTMGLWGMVSLGIVLFTYLFTPNVGFLLNGQSFYRQLFVPAALLLCWALLLWPNKERSTDTMEK